MMGAPTLLPPTVDQLPKTNFDAPSMSDREFHAFRDLILARTGISLSEIKKNLVRTRLRRRLLERGCKTYEEYYELLVGKNANGPELELFINCITTNKTDFFREPHHFEYLKKRALPEAVAARSAAGDRVIRVWSAGCSTGQEAYTLAITLDQFFATKPGWDVRILASDIDSDCLRRAKAGLFDESQIEDVPMHLKKKYFLRGTGNSAGKVLVRKELADKIAFRQINFAEGSWPIHTKFDFVFCRNVIIYFDQQFQEQLLRRFAGYLLPHGLLFLGHSESITWMKDLKPLGQTIYKPVGSSNESEKRPVKRIVAGEALASDERIEISTLLGSCVATCLYDSIAKVGGMNHVLFADDATGYQNATADSADSARGATELLLRKLIRLGGETSRMVAKLYGGAELFGDTIHSSSNVGGANVRAVVAFLNAKGIPVVEQRVGGKSAVRISMQPDTGCVSAEATSDVQ